jgi:hypothetical protein
MKLHGAPMVHASRPGYSGGRDQEDGSPSPAQVKHSQDPISNYPIQKKASGVAQLPTMSS